MKCLGIESTAHTFSIGIINQTDPIEQNLLCIFVIFFGTQLIKAGITIMMAIKGAKEKVSIASILEAITIMISATAAYVAMGVIKYIFLTILEALNAVAIIFIAYMVMNKGTLADSLISMISFVLLGIIFLGMGITALLIGLILRFI